MRVELVPYWFLALDAPLPVVEAIDVVMQYRVDEQTLFDYLDRRCKENAQLQTNTCPSSVQIWRALPDLHLSLNIKPSYDGTQTWLLIDGWFGYRCHFGFYKTHGSCWLPAFGPNCSYQSPPSPLPLRTLQLVFDDLLALIK
jgi:hypothetical protein